MLDGSGLRNLDCLQKDFHSIKKLLFCKNTLIPQTDFHKRVVNQVNLLAYDIIICFHYCSCCMSFMKMKTAEPKK